ncbi:MAG: tetratricopeptide repeat protein [Chloroflexota bacterium]|nr:MAG: tetratricopeptide repeat protein [Chloroflexota bacterium]
MTKFTIVSPQVVEETSGRLVLTPKRSTQIWAVVILLMVLFLGLAIAAMGWYFDSVCTMAVGIGPLLLGVLMIARNPILVRLTIDDTRGQLSVEQTRLIGLGFLPRRQAASFGLDRVTSMELTENMLSTAFGVKIEVGREDVIILNTRRDGRQASMLLDKISALIGQNGQADQPVVATPEGPLPGRSPDQPPADASEATFAQEAVPVTGWRLALAAVFGLLTAFVAAWIWFLVARATDTRFGLLALMIGFTVGLVVSLMSGGSRDISYGLLGAGLSAVGVIAGELLIFGNLELDYRYELDAIMVVIYIMAVWQGWAIPRRSIRLVRENSGRVNENNWRPMLYVGLALLLAIVAVGAFVGIVPMPTEVLASYNAQQAYKYLDEGDLQSAAAELEEALSFQPDWAIGNLLLGELYQESSLYADAERLYLVALEHDPELGAAHLGLAKTYMGLGREDDALAAAESAKAGYEVDGQAHLISGYIYFIREQWSASEAAMAEALRMGLEGEDLVLGYLLSGYSFMHLEEYQDALAVAETLIDHEPENAYAHFLSGEANYWLGNRDAARSDLETALALGLDTESELGARSILAELD